MQQKGSECPPENIRRTLAGSVIVVGYGAEFREVWQKHGGKSNAKSRGLCGEPRQLFVEYLCEKEPTPPVWGKQVGIVLDLCRCHVGNRKGVAGICVADEMQAGAKGEV